MGSTASNAKYGKKRNGTGKRYEDSFLGFVDINLTQPERDECEELSASKGVDVAAFLAELVENGYKFSLAADWEHSMVIATVTGRADNCENKGYALSGRGPHAYGALVTLYYKVVTLCGWGPWATPEELEARNQLKLWS